MENLAIRERVPVSVLPTGEEYRTVRQESCDMVLAIQYNLRPQGRAVLPPVVPEFDAVQSAIRLAELSGGMSRKKRVEKALPLHPISTC